MPASVDAHDVPGQWGADPPGGLTERRPEWAYGPFSWHSLGGLSRCGIVPGATMVGADRVKRTCDRSTDRLTVGFTFQARRAQRYRLQQGASLVPQAMLSRPHMEAGRLTDTTPTKTREPPRKWRPDCSHSNSHRPRHRWGRHPRRPDLGPPTTQGDARPPRRRPRPRHRHRDNPLAVLAHDLGDRRLIGGWPARAVWGLWLLYSCSQRGRALARRVLLA
jgi:hypothetical protein